MQKLNLPNVTLICITSKNFDVHLNALKYSSRGINWGAVKLIGDLELNSLDEYSYAMVYKLRDYVTTDYCVTIQDDGFIINPEMWDWNWLNYDYIGSPWPLPKDDFSYRTPEGKLERVGNGAVSLRSKKLLDLPFELDLEWKSYYGNCNEDGFLCVHNRKILEENGVKFAPLSVAKHFAREHEIEENQDVVSPFGFHKLNGRNQQYANLI